MTTWNPYVFRGAYIIVPRIFLIFIFFQTVICKRVKQGGKRILYSGRLWLLFWVFTILCATVIERPAYSGSHLRLELFWTIRKAWEAHSGRHWYNIIGNIALFIPLGALLPTAFLKLRVWWKVTLAGLLFSGIIELFQYIFKFGLCELDDLIHNTTGAFVGYQMFIVLAWLAVRKKCGESNETSKAKAAGSICAIGLLALLFFVLLCINRPDWSGVTVF